MYGEINQILFPSHILPFSLSCLQTRRRRANVINSQMELSLLSDGLVKPFPEEEVRELGGGTIKKKHIMCYYLFDVN